MDDAVSPYFLSASNGSTAASIAADAEKEKNADAAKAQERCNNFKRKYDEKDELVDDPENQAGSSTPSSGSDRLEKNFFNKECSSLAKALLGQILARKINGTIMRGTIVETESYLGGIDVASHSYNGKRTPKTEAMYMEPGTLYVYSIYGMYYCLNISSQGEGACVLIRALEPVEGIKEMTSGRTHRRASTSRPLKIFELCNGPSKLCLALNITKDLCNKADASVSNEVWLEKGSCIPEKEIITTKRIGINSAGEEWANKPLRYYVFDNKNVSVKDRKAEANLFAE